MSVKEDECLVELLKYYCEFFILLDFLVVCVKFCAGTFSSKEAGQIERFLTSDFCMEDDVYAYAEEETRQRNFQRINDSRGIRARHDYSLNDDSQVKV